MQIGLQLQHLYYWDGYESSQLVSKTLLPKLCFTDCRQFYVDSLATYKYGITVFSLKICNISYSKSKKLLPQVLLNCKDSLYKSSVSSDYVQNLFLCRLVCSVRSYMQVPTGDMMAPSNGCSYLIFSYNFITVYGLVRKPSSR